jgi:alpha-beta hydrolase superfamily lysophospholipase
MSADPRIESHYPSGGLAEALYFNSGDHTLFGWLHRSTEGTLTGSGIGLVICKPFGYEAICSHRSVRAFAEAAAALGVPALRFDYLGTGDSADIEPQADQLDVWAKDIVAAVIELQRRTGVERVCLLGFRLGALLATLASRQCKAVTALILVAPVLSGRRFLRELRTTRMAASLAAGGQVEPAGVSTPDIQSAGSGSMEVSGFSLSGATIAALAQVDLTTQSVPEACEMLIVDGINLTTARAWVETLIGLGVRSEYLALPGMVEMLMTDPRFAVVPAAAVEAMCDWLLRLQRSSPVRVGATDHNLEFAAVPPIPMLQLPKSGELGPQALVTERPVFLASEALLFGIVTEPSQGDKRRRAVILLNVGAEHHIGSSRMYVSLARQWAQHGYTVLRLDLAGIGDSATRAGRTDNEVFPPAALDDVRVAVEFMRSRYGIRDITLGGLCSGAYHSLRAAIAVLPVNRVLLVNPMNFFWKEGMTAENLQESVDVARNVRFYRERVFSRMIWKRILTRELNIWRIVRILIQRPLLKLESMMRNLARYLRVHLPRDLGWELQEIGARGVKMVFVFARGEPGIDVLKLEAGSAVKQLGDHCHVHIIDSADHIFSHMATRAVLEKILSQELFARNPWGDAIPSIDKEAKF